MKTLTLNFFCLFLIIFLSSKVSFAQKKQIIEIKEGYSGMIGYGSLMSLESMEQILGHKCEDSIYQVHLKGFIREWSFLQLINDPTVEIDEQKIFLVREFSDMIIGVCDTFGENFRTEYLKSTKPYSGKVVSYKDIIRKEEHK